MTIALDLYRHRIGIFMQYGQNNLKCREVSLMTRYFLSMKLLIAVLLLSSNMALSVQKTKSQPFVKNLSNIENHSNVDSLQYYLT